MRASSLVWVVRLAASLDLLASRVFGRLVGRAFAAGSGPLRMHPSSRVSNPRRIRSGRIAVGRNAWLNAIVQDSAGTQFSPELRIGSGTHIYDGVHINCASSVEIGEKVLIAPNAFITDCTHCFGDRAVAIIDQPVRVTGPVKIGRGAWIGRGAAVIGPVTLGVNCVVGANAVVTHDVPDYGVVSGVPARLHACRPTGEGTL